MLRLDNPLRRYDWGSTELLPDLLGLQPDGTPWAELWLGAHPDSPSTVLVDGAARPLDAVLEQDPQTLLGPAVVQAFGPRLPFLLKLLAAARPLSLQCHPSAAQAAEGFAREDAAGVPRDAAHRNYRDAQHKPEMIYALTRFEALCGFRSPARAAALLAALEVAALGPVLDDLAGPDPLRTALTRLLRMPAADLGPLVADVAAACRARRTDGSDDDAALATAEDLAAAHPADAGVVLSLLLNRITLEPGQAVFLPAGNVHAYLHGMGVEVMACSDNVLRGGLTSKHVDVDELLRVVDVAPYDVPLVPVADPAPGLRVLAPPVAEFALGVLTPTAGAVTLAGGAPRLVLCTAGSLAVDGLALALGQSVLVPASVGDVAVSGTGAGFVATPAGGL